MPNTVPSARYDLPWKAVLKHALRAFLDFYFPDFSARIDWRQRPRFRDKEFARSGFSGAPNVMVADILAEVRMRDGRQGLVHIEIQTQRDAAMAKRMHDYNYRISETYDLPLASLVLLADEYPRWRPASFDQQFEGTATAFSAKLHLTALLFRHGWNKKRILVLFDAINWMMTLPEPYQRRYWQAARKLGKEHEMKLLNPLEQMFFDDGIKKGLEQGLEQGRREGAVVLLERLLVKRFGPLSQTTRKKLATASLAQLEAWSDALDEAQSLKQIWE